MILLGPGQSGDAPIFVPVLAAIRVPRLARAAHVPDPIAAELERCRSVSYEQTNRLTECRKVWAEKRRQFLGQSSDTPRNPARPDPEATPSASVKDQSRLPSGLFPTPQPTER